MINIRAEKKRLFLKFTVYEFTFLQHIFYKYAHCIRKFTTYKK